MPISEKNIYVQRTRRLSTTGCSSQDSNLRTCGPIRKHCIRVGVTSLASHDRCEYLKHSALLQEVAGIEVEVNAASLPFANPNIQATVESFVIELSPILFNIERISGDADSGTTKRVIQHCEG